eukprot:gene3621-6437_t
MDTVKKVLNYVFLVDIFKLPEQHEGSTIGCCMTMLYPVVSGVIILILLLLRFDSNLNGSFYTTTSALVDLKRENPNYAVNFNLRFRCDLKDGCLVYPKPKAGGVLSTSDQCYFTPKFVKQGQDFPIKKFCYKDNLQIFTSTENNTATIDNTIHYGYLYSEERDQFDNFLVNIPIHGNQALRTTKMNLDIEQFTNLEWWTNSLANEQIYYKPTYDSFFEGQNSSDIFFYDQVAGLNTPNDFYCNTTLTIPQNTTDCRNKTIVTTVCMVENCTVDFNNTCNTTMNNSSICDNTTCINGTCLDSFTCISCNNGSCTNTTFSNTTTSNNTTYCKSCTAGVCNNGTCSVPTCKNITTIETICGPNIVCVNQTYWNTSCVNGTCFSNATCTNATCYNTICNNGSCLNTTCSIGNCFNSSYTNETCSIVLPIVNTTTSNSTRYFYCYSIGIEMSDSVVSTEVRANFDTKGFFETLALFGGLHGLVSLIFSNFVFFALQVIYFLPANISKLIARPALDHTE